MCEMGGLDTFGGERKVENLSTEVQYVMRIVRIGWIPLMKGVTRLVAVTRTRFVALFSSHSMRKIDYDRYCRSRDTSPKVSVF